MDSSYAKQRCAFTASITMRECSPLRSRALLRLQELFRSVAALDCVSSLLESSDYRDELLDVG